LLKGILIGAGVILALAAVCLLAMNLYVQSAGTQKRIERALSSALKAPVHIVSTIVTPWSGLKASGITVPQTPPAAGNFLIAPACTAHFNWTGLFNHRLEVTDVSVSEPVVEWFESPGGRWQLPRAAAPTATAQASPQPTAAKTPAAGAWAVDVHTVTLSGATFDFWDEKGMRLLEFAGVEAVATDPSAAGTQGQASARSGALRNGLFFTGVRTGWSYLRGTAKLSSFQAGLDGGQLRGGAQVATLAKHTPYSVDVNFDGLNVARLMADAGVTGQQASGTLKGWIDLGGNSGKTSTINGSGSLELDGGRLQNIELFELLGQALQIPDLVELNLKTAVLDARVVSGVVNVDKLELESQNLRLAAHGTVGLDGKLALDARLTVNSTISKRLEPFIRDCFTPGETPGEQYVDFQIGNTLEHPKQTLIEKILGSKLQGQMNDWFKNYLIKKNKTTKPEPEPEGTPP
jgi:type II secretion system protein N